MKMEDKYSERKPTRIKNYDYSSVGAYFVTICTQDRKQILSEIIRKNNAPVSETNDYAVGEGLAPPALRGDTAGVCLREDNIRPYTMTEKTKRREQAPALQRFDMPDRSL